MHATRPDQREEPNLAAIATEHGGLPIAPHAALVQIFWAGALSLGAALVRQTPCPVVGPGRRKHLLVFSRYGGEVWLLTLIGTGRVHAVSVQIMNDIFAERIREEAEREPVSDARRAQPQSKARASSSRRSSVASALAATHPQRCRRGLVEPDIRPAAGGGGPILGKGQGESIKVGHPFKDRDGAMFQPGPLHLGTFERSLNILVERIEAGEVTWPPAP